MYILCRCEEALRSYFKAVFEFLSYIDTIY